MRDSLSMAQGNFNNEIYLNEKYSKEILFTGAHF
jgi:hypothetical protein